MSVKVFLADWNTDKKVIQDIRRKVFIEEQSVPEELEWDEFDKTAIHCLAKSGETVVATGRLLNTGQIGRMSVLKPYRNKGIGEKVLIFLISEHRKRSDETIFIHAQTHALEFYKKAGFIIEGDEYTEAGIPHYTMILK